MRISPPVPTGNSIHLRTRRWSRTALLCAFVTLITGFSATWVSAGREHPARVSFMDGRAAYETAGDVDWNEVTLNLPLVSGDRIMGHPDSRIEVELGDGNFVRISGETDVLFPELSQEKTILKLHEGDLILRVADAEPDPGGLGSSLGQDSQKGTLPNPDRSRRLDPPGGPQGPGGSQQPAWEGASGDGTTVASWCTPHRNPGAGSGTGRIRALEWTARRRDGQQPFRRVPGRRRLPGSPVAGPAWRLGPSGQIRPRLGARRLGGMGSVPIRTVALPLFWTDVGEP